ncbi:MAG: 4-hydroxy-tetrahydrodipicolinate reductase [Acidimicrobiia bacterium]
MIRVGVSGAAGRMGMLTTEAIESTSDMQLCGRYAPGHGHDDRRALAGCDVVVEFARPDAVMENLAEWSRLGLHVVVGTSGFDDQRLADLKKMWGAGPPKCLVVPNFSIGAVLMMSLAEKAAPYFSAGEIIELHHDRKVDAPSGTALSTAARMSPSGSRAVDSIEALPGARGAEVGGVWVHSVRLPGLLAHQEILLGNPGEVLSIRHDTTDRAAFVPGILLAVRSIEKLEPGVSIGLDGLMGL